jgi:hypothetical protein
MDCKFISEILCQRKVFPTHPAMESTPIRWQRPAAFGRKFAVSLLTGHNPGRLLHAMAFTPGVIIQGMIAQWGTGTSSNRDESSAAVPGTA